MKCLAAVGLACLSVSDFAYGQTATQTPPAAPATTQRSSQSSSPLAAASAVPVIALPEVNVVANTPLLGSGVDRNKIPAQTNVLTGKDITRQGTADLTGALNQNVPGVTLDYGSGNPFQPNLFYHGFQASPLQGNPQGMAVYLNGVRFNDAFGDTVNWDLVPDLAIDRVNVEGSNPVFGLNALGGSVSVQLKNGFTYHGGEFDISGGSFGKVEGEFQYGKQAGNTSTYIAGTAAHEGGWRDLQSSDLYNFFGDVGWRNERAEVHLNIVAADSVLNGPGTSPVELLAADPRSQFTAPNLIANKYALISLNGTYAINDTTSAQGIVYYDYFQQRVVNGNASDFSPCGDGSGNLCEAPGVYATDRAGNPIPDFLGSGSIPGLDYPTPYSELDQQTTNTNGYGVAGQITSQSPIFGHPNQLVVGLSFDGANTTFSGSSQIGGLTDLTRVFVGPGITIDQADGSNAPVRAGITNAYYGALFTDTFDITSRLSANVSGRFNAAEIDLTDENGTALNGNHYYSRFNPAAGLTYKVLPWLTAYAGYSEANRAPTPAELSCASAASPCSLANFFVGDPDLKQVVAHTIEAGVRGQAHPYDGATLDWNVGFFRTNLDDDILFVNSPIQGRAFFQNVGSTRRQGVDIGLKLTTGRLLAYIGYSYIDATFQIPFTESSQNNPGADADGNIRVQPGDHLPGVPNNLIKVGVDYKVTNKWTVGVTGVGATGQYLFGDEANLQKKLPGYFVLNVNTSYQVTPNIQVFGLVENVLNATYYTYGTFSPTSDIFLAQAPNATNTRSYNISAPVGGFAGARVTF